MAACDLSIRQPGQTLITFVTNRPPETRWTDTVVALTGAGSLPGVQAVCRLSQPDLTAPSSVLNGNRSFPETVFTLVDEGIFLMILKT
jgi:hypothetical protein